MQNLFHLLRLRSAKMRPHDSHDLSRYLFSPDENLAGNAWGFSADADNLGTVLHRTHSCGMI
jgi:hypothetical protein